MNKFTDSDLEPKMVATRTFENILQHIQTSNLNFQLTLSPFAANISLKKSLAKDKSGAPLLSSSCSYNTAGNITALATTNMKLENELISLKIRYANVLNECETIQQKSVKVEDHAAVKPEGGETLHQELLANKNLVMNLNAHIKQLLKENEECRIKIENQSKEIKDLEFSNKTRKEVADDLNKKLSATTLKFNKEKIEISKEHKAEVKFWRKELGEETKMKIQLEKKLKTAMESDKPNAKISCKVGQISEPPRNTTD